MARARRGPTATAAFGSGRRESHDASDFYRRFAAPVVSADDTVATTSPLDTIWHASSTDMSRVATGSIALVVTSPPYFAGKAYETDLGASGIPGSYLEYLDLLHDVFAECARVLEPGGRIAVNVANLGRKPYRSLSADVIAILDGLGLLLRGEVVWAKGKAAGGSCAWGTFASPRNPVLRDVTERVVIAGKGRFDRAVAVADRQRRGLPHAASIGADEFVEATTDLWEIPPESATRVGHPAPFPVALPARLIDLYTFVGDVVLDPFMGAGSTAVAAVERGRHYLGFDTDAGYVAAARARVAAAVPGSALRDAGGRLLDDAAAALAAAGFADVERKVTLRSAGVTADLAATDARGRRWAFHVAGAASATGAAGLRRREALADAIAAAAVWHAVAPETPFALLTTEVPAPSTPGARALAAVTGAGRPIAAVVCLGGESAAADLGRLASGPSA